MCSLGVCNFQNKYCGCQTYKEDENNPEKCFYCNHYNAFHTGFSPPPQNTSTPLLGTCQKDGVSCGCQAFVANPNNELKCKYCDHFTAFHKYTSPDSSPLSSSLTNIESNLSSSLLSSSSNINTSAGDSRFRDEAIKNRSMPIIKKRKRNQRFRNQNSPNTIASRGRPANVSLGLNHLLLFTQESWENNSAPRENTSAWIEMRDNGLIIENVLFNENTAEAINALITRSFPSVNEYNWIILNGSTSKLKAATSQEKSLKNFRENMSKSNKRLYLALTSNNSSETEADNNHDEDFEIKSECTD
ncbi:hypothetical protein RhiirA5_483264 [Rhizophagus irregularis]|uniref:Uncharacterized protein n=3 Tax=Rhizophagus irregularis TaxID=588596 RepID=U9UUN3_RHIID|nr:hypothetical protein GLOIN_2v1486819 [Rhizophagus irregularis DAOM 181602=DAOM 197198]EXX75234.1 hypothetical protein RirG_043480 [Rhizophagus irregularis DAOM 197198w]PKC06280.1 hypothetical protein RhiirA5_483263 [Rhizophagus irregularis]PKC06281.1 hypothetical protein RhiirA5_483264 [Rhizophagus irregularis]PKC68960.1 hypothetical protein RhiirA1_505801 [Rhizophagus irregularis]PKK74796.1 hypothetical protein RhiirC2_846554 [Rhizophagus irregularis]|eukprot:XP_025167564.1 hypothetical protein GLOIN_2v1486819 [Rhizophagus irregularis DAOM 181602=DAOM 197198]